MDLRKTLTQCHLHCRRLQAGVQNFRFSLNFAASLSLELLLLVIKYSQLLFLGATSLLGTADFDTDESIPPLGDFF